MPQEKIQIELSRDQAISLVEGLTGSGDPDMDELSIALRNKIGLGTIHYFQWVEPGEEDDDDTLLRVVQINEETPKFEMFDDQSGEWVENEDDPEEILISLAMFLMYSGDEG
jgi:hypothetical protein